MCGMRLGSSFRRPVVIHWALLPPCSGLAVSAAITGLSVSATSASYDSPNTSAKPRHPEDWGEPQL